MQVRSFGVTVRGQQVLPPRTPGWHELLYATRGVLTVHTEQGSWVVPPHRAVWIPAGLSYQMELSPVVELRCLYLRENLKMLSGSSRADAVCCVVNVSPLLREIIRRIVKIGALDTARSEQRRLTGVLIDEIATLESTGLQLPNPRDSRAVQFASAVAGADLASNSFEELLTQCGTSRRTMERLFVQETGMSLGQWMRRHCLLNALKLLAAGEGVDSVAMRLGYNSASSFIAMFRKELGTTPGKYFNNPSESKLEENSAASS